MTNQAQYREVKRKAAVGERIKVVIGGTHGDGHHKVGDVLYVIFADRWSDGSGISVSKRNYAADIWSAGTGINHDRYVVLEPVTELTAPSPFRSDPLYAAFLRFVTDNANEIRAILPEVEALVTKAPAILAPITPKLTATQKRAQVIAKATADVAELLRIGGSYRDNLPDGSPLRGILYLVELHVNREKRAVTAIVRGKHSGNIRGKATAKCSPADVFHAEIGKAIALRKALGLAVPSEYTDAPQPDDLVAGTVVHLRYDNSRYEVRSRRPEMDGVYDAGTAYTLDTGWDGVNNFVNIDDTDVDYSAETPQSSAA